MLVLRLLNRIPETLSPETCNKQSRTTRRGFELFALPPNNSAVLVETVLIDIHIG
jgi:hypothetical protein